VVFEEQLKVRTEQIRTWLEHDHLLLTKVHELLGREGLLVSYSNLRRFARKCRPWENSYPKTLAYSGV
jgi:hypothetical protein